jgi:hypothetical protein
VAARPAPIHAARTVKRKRSTSVFSRSLSVESEAADDNTCEEAVPVSLAL